MAVIIRTLAQSTDDALRWNSGYDRTSHGCRVGHYREPPSGNLFGYTYAMRFQNISIPKNAVINSADLTFRAILSNSTNTVNSKIRGEAADNPTIWPSTFPDFDTRFGNLTTAEVNWDAIGAWVVAQPYSTPDIKTVIQELVDRAGWSSGNAMCLFWDDNDDRSSQVDDATRDAQSYFTDAPVIDNAVILNIDYTPVARGQVMFIQR